VSVYFIARHSLCCGDKRFHGRNSEYRPNIALRCGSNNGATNIFLAYEYLLRTNVELGVSGICRVTGFNPNYRFCVDNAAPQP